MRLIIINYVLFFLLLKCIESLTISDLGLPNINHCTFSYNQSLYILGETHNVSITFGNPWDTAPPKISIQSNTSPRRIVCTITRSGKVLLLPSLQAFDSVSPSISTWKPNQNITYSGSQDAVDKFTLSTSSFQDYAVTAFNDYILIQGGRDNNTQYQTTYILDTRFPTQYVWYEVSNTSLTPPPASINASLAATSRWILYFRTELSSTQSYITYVDCFDPFSFLWLGTITTFNTSTNLIQAIPIVSSVQGSDSLLLVPSWSGYAHNRTVNAFYRLDISTWIYNDVHISAVTALSTKRDVLEYKPLSGGTVTPFSTDLAVFYGGITSDQQSSNISFFNTTSLEFLSQPQWLTRATVANPGNNEGIKRLPIILGTVMGGLLFIALVVLFAWCMIRRKRNRMGHQNHQQVHENVWICWPFIPKRNNFETTQTKKEVTPYVLSPIPAASPIQMFPSTSNAIPTNEKPPMLTSRFIEHFDYHAFPLSKNNGNNKTAISLQNIASSSSSPLKESSGNQIPRSASSNV